MTQCWRRAEECFFERAPDRAVAGTIDNAEFYDLVLQQPQGPACASFGRLGTGQGNQLGLLLAVKNPSNGRHRAQLAAQYGLEAFFHQLFAHPMIRLSLHPLPASETSAFNKIRAFSTRRAGLFPFRINVSSRSRSSPLSLTTYFSIEISFAAMIASLASRWRRKRITKSFQIGGRGRLGWFQERDASKGHSRRLHALHTPRTGTQRTGKTSLEAESRI